MDDFQFAEEIWLSTHRKRRGGERLRRLTEGYRVAEQDFVRQIWWPTFHNFNFLHPEYEVVDYMGVRRFIDIAYIRSGIKIAFEIDGFGAHYDKLDRVQFCNQWIRHMHLLNDGWIVVRIGWDDLTNRPRLWQQLIQQLLSRYFLEVDRQKSVVSSLTERAVFSFACQLGRPIRISDVRELLKCDYPIARRVIAALEEKNLFVSVGKGQIRKHLWRVNARESHLPSMMNRDVPLLK